MSVNQVGEEAARRLARLGSVAIAPGLTDEEFTAVEERFGFVFADDHRAFLAAGLPLSGPNGDPERGWSWPNWRDLDSELLNEQVTWPMAAALEGVMDGREWSTDWNRRPKEPALAEAKARRKLADLPAMVPVYSHRYLPAGARTAGHPVLSIHRLSDMVVCGANLAHYIENEFLEPEVTAPFWRDHL